MITLKRTTYDDPDFITLIRQLDAELLNIYQEEQKKFTPHNKMDPTVKTVIALDGNKPIACGALRAMKEQGIVEVKRMFVDPSYRGKGISKQVLNELETWAAEQGYNTIKLETANKQSVAIQLYQNAGYSITEPYGEYKNIPESICMEKKIN